MDNAISLMDAAESSLRAGYAPSDMTVLISPEGGIRMIANSDWPLTSLQAHHGATEAYRISQLDRKIRVEGKQGARTCTLETAPVDWSRGLLTSAMPPAYTVIPAGF